ncbi:hypothetical protein HF324_18505 [Chitinophaga oryzae]|uniref:ATPase n=1 Tax=Chitinophaga oryzae TaxID=2725414 RepID=A0ABX6LI80_9BACT|nr:hypothetical protein [Chitinophaga oryzae]QJB39741.1 hypothetical protein HF324_18505 [Chitinophaga oryzae]
MEEKRTNRTSSLEDLLYQRVPANTESFELTPEEREAAIRDAQRRKEDRIKYEQDKERRRLWETELLRPWTPTEMMMFVEWKAAQRGLNLVKDADNHAVLKALCHYFTRSEKFCTAGEGFSLQKGIMLCGPVGTGKTTVMELFQANQYQSYRIFACRDIANSFKEEGEGALQIFSRPFTTPAHPSTFYQNTLGVCLDDVGTEGLKHNFGDQVNVVADVVLNRYGKKIPFNLTHITTNLTVEEITQCYSERVRSRMREMFNMLVLNGTDRRK